MTDHINKQTDELFLFGKPKNGHSKCAVCSSETVNNVSECISACAATPVPCSKMTICHQPDRARIHSLDTLFVCRSVHATASKDVLKLK